MLAGVLGQAGLEALDPGPAERYPVAFLSLILFSLVGLMLGSRGSALDRVAMVLLGVMSGVVLLLSLVPGNAGLVVGLAGLVAAFLAARQGD
jgi:hypothetical protein